MNYSKYIKRINELCIDEKRYYINGERTPYIVRSDGYVYITNNRKSQIKYVKKYIMPQGYISVRVVTDSKNAYNVFVHRMVAEMFIYNDDPINKVEVNHIDGNKSNNNVYNLEWVTPKENMHHAIANGFVTIVGEEATKSYSYINSKEKITDDVADMVCQMLELTDIPIYNIANSTDVDINVVRGIAHGELFTNISKKYDLSKRTIDASNSLSNDEVRKICEYLSNKEIPIDEVAKDLNVHPQLVYDICIGAAYNDISVEYDLSERFVLNEPTSKGIIHNICNQIANTDMTFIEIAKYNGVNPNVVRNIFYGTNWSDISKNYDFSRRKDPIKIISDDIVVKVCELLQNTKKTDAEIASELAISQRIVSSIRRHGSHTNISKNYNFDHRISTIKCGKTIDIDTVRKICELLQNTDMNYHEIGKELGVKPYIVNYIKNRSAWANISKDYDFSHRTCPTKLDEDTVINICNDLQNTDVSDDDIAKKYNIDKQIVHRIRRKDSYKEITEKYDFSKRPSINHITPKQALKICELLEKGYGREYISKHLEGVTEANVRSIKEKRKFTDISKYFDF